MNVGERSNWSRVLIKAPDVIRDIGEKRFKKVRGEFWGYKWEGRKKPFEMARVIFFSEDDASQLDCGWVSFADEPWKSE